ncbi:MAG TPA: Gfo/Idh/MocA family oxidoreductase [Gemmataceae bacterium]|jgi:predicted dehydrogenase|nr:Gfo/Idh/MocA family oxidoreductase [Gemmataceae bacterium]
MKPTKRLSRRQFLRAGAAAAGVFTIVPRHVLGGPGHLAPSDKVNVAVIGVGGRGRENVRELFKVNDCQIIAVADPAESFSTANFYYKSTGGRAPAAAEIEKHYAATTPNHRCAQYEDFRVMLEKEKAIDAILCATPDHLHAYVSTVAMRAGKHVYCEKPLTHNVWEARRVAQVAKETKVATQMGNQGHSTEGIRQTCELIWSGAIGPVREVHAWVGTKRWNPTLTGRPPETMPVPAGLNWDLWLGPREPRPFHTAYFPVAWRDFWAFGSSTLGDFGCHDLDSSCWSLDLRAPESIEAHAAGASDKEIGPHGAIVYYEFGPRGDKPAVKIAWYDGGLQPERPAALPNGEALPARGVLFVGEKGMMLCGGAGGKPRLLGTGNGTPPTPTLPRSNGHHRDWIDACKGGKPASSNFEYGARLSEIALLGVLSLRTGRRIQWNAAEMKASGFSGADAVIKESYRKGWEVA